MNHSRLKSYAIDGACFLCLTLLALWYRWPVTESNSFHNEDAAGIVYNAELLLKGMLPYVDSLELKAPGAFFIVAGIFKLFGRSLAAVSGVAIFWSVLSSLGIFVGARQISGRLGAVIATALYVWSSPISDSIDFNYNAWMMAPYVWCACFALLGLKRGGAWWFASGFCVAVSGLIRRQTAVICPLLLLAVLFAQRCERPENWPPLNGKSASRLRNFFWLAGGVVAGFLPIALFYAAHGELGALIQNYVFSNIGWKYIGQSQLSFVDKWIRFGDGLLGFQAYLVLAFWLGTVSTLLAIFRGSSQRLIIYFNTAFFALSFIGAAFGLRFFKSYYIQMLPAAVWLAVSLEGAVLPCFNRDFWQRPSPLFKRRMIIFAATIALAIPAIYKDYRQLRFTRRYIQHAYSDTLPVAQIIHQNTSPDETIWVWGRWAWPFYFYTDRMSPSRQYKSLGILTNDLTNTWKRPTIQTHFLPDTPWPELMSDLKKNRPAYIILSNNELLEGFDAFLEFLDQDYKPVHRLSGRRFKIYRRKDHQSPKIDAP